MPAPKKFALGLALTAWAAGLAAGFGALERYAVTAGGARPPSDRVGEFLSQHRQAGRGLVVLAVHPLCPCTDASLAELGDLLARSHGTCDAVVLEYQPLAPPAGWSQSGPFKQLAGVRVPVLLDRGGAIASALGAETSGHAVFVDAHGDIRFHGGITLARGHRGRAPGQDAILAVLDGGQANVASAPVFGCALETECNAEAAP